MMPDQAKMRELNQKKSRTFSEITPVKVEGGKSFGANPGSSISELKTSVAGINSSTENSRGS